MHSDAENESEPILPFPGMEVHQILYDHLFHESNDTEKAIEESSEIKRLPGLEKLVSSMAEILMPGSSTYKNDDFCYKLADDSNVLIEEIYYEFLDKENNEEQIELNQKFNDVLKGGTEDDWLDLITDANEVYPELSSIWDYYGDKLKELWSSEDEQGVEIEAVKEKISEHIDDQFQLNFLDELNQEFTDKTSELSKQMNDMIEQMSGFVEDMSFILGYMGRFWDTSQGAWKNTGWKELQKYAEILEKEDKIKDLVEILGRFQESEDEFETEMIEKTKIINEWKTSSIGKSEIIGVHYSDDLGNLLPAEVAMLSSPETELIFSKNFAEKKLLTFDFSARSRFQSEEKELDEIQKAMNKKGPIIACVDTSGSMHGMPEHVAKVFIFAILKMALKEGRKCYLISFSTGIETLELTDMVNSIGHLVEFLTHSFQGGTDATPAFREALRMLEVDDYRKADVVMVSDFIMPELPRDLLDRVQDQQTNNGTRFHSLSITNQANPVHEGIFDNNWVFDSRDISSMNDLASNFRRGFF